MRLREACVCLVLGVLSVPLRPARACGPDFPPEALREREHTLATLPESDFQFEAMRLVPKPPEAFLVVEGNEPAGVRDGGGARETELYLAGARAFTDGRWDEAREHFEAVLALPAEERRHFSSFAAFMLGRLEQDSPETRPQAEAHYAQVREWVGQGFADPLGLAVASLGQEARLHLQDGDDVGALQLYAEQAAHGSTSGAASLLFVARALSKDETRLRRALQAPVGQRLMAAYAWTRGHEEIWVGDSDATVHPPLASLLDALAAVPGLAGADRLAATAWREGRFDVAERFADVERTPLAAWVKAKLALRRGDASAADRWLAEAAEGFPKTENWQTREYEYSIRPYVDVESERTLLALMRGDFHAAGEHVLQTCAWPDIAYVTERVLEVDEVQRLLAQHASGPELQCTPEFLWYSEEPLPTLNARLRLLLGRRMLREGRGAEALEYFRGTKWEEPSRQYVEALDRARSAWRVVDQAQALYAASRLARRDGMELLGTETKPDWAWALGEFEVNEFQVEATPAEGAPRASSVLAPLTFVPDAEQARLNAHAPQHAVRYQYRATAADLAEKAAALVPTRSQAYAALLCHAARYTSRFEPERSQAFWDTYVKKGALLHEPMVFGQSCPEPDFERLRQAQLALPKRPRLRTLATVGGGLLLPVVGFVLMRRRRKESADSK